MAARSIFAATLLGFCLTAWVGCTERERFQEPNPPDDDVTTAVIGPGGGELRTEEFRFVVPPGAFDATVTLSSRDATSSAPADPRRVSPVFEIAGLPENVALPCSVEIAVPSPGAGIDHAILLEETDTFISSLGRFDRCPVTLEAVTVGTRVRAILPVTPEAAKGPGHADEASGTILVAAIAAAQVHVTPQQHFEIHYSTPSLQAAAVEAGGYLENAYAMLASDLGLSWAKRTRRIKVTIRPFAEADKEAWGLHCPSKWYGADYDEILLNQTQIAANPGSDDLKATTGHELFHLMQHLYDPRYRISQGKPNEWFWMNEAMSTWFERKMVSPTHIPFSVRETDYRFHLSHGLQYTPSYSIGVSCTDCWMVQNHGYGASLFLGDRFESFTGGERKIGEILEQRLAGLNPVPAIQQVTASYAGGMAPAWRGFCTHWMESAIYASVPGFPSPAKIVEGRNSAFTFNSLDHSVATFQWQASNYGARLFVVYFSGEAGIPDDAPAKIRFVDEEGGCEVMVYSFVRDAAMVREGSIGQPGETLEIPEVGTWSAEGRALAILVIRTEGNQSGQVPMAVQVAVERCDPDLPVVLNSVEISEGKVTRDLAGCVQKIDLRGMGLTDPQCLDGIDQYASGLEEVILLGRAGFGNDNAMASIDLTDLSKCKKLKKLDLRYLSLQSIDLTPLGQCPELTHLDLVGNALTSLDLSPLRTCLKFVDLRVRDNRIQGLDLTPLAVGDSVQNLILSNNLLDGINLTPLGSMPSLRILEMNTCDLGSINLAPLASCSKLYFVTAGENRIATIDLAPLAGHEKLEFVSFNSNALTQVDLTPLATCAALRSLNLLRNGLTSIDLTPLESLAALRWLHLEQNYLDGETCGRVCAFKAAHPSCEVSNDCGCAR